MDHFASAQSVWRGLPTKAGKPPLVSSAAASLAMYNEIFQQSMKERQDEGDVFKTYIGIAPAPWLLLSTIKISGQTASDWQTGFINSILYPPDWTDLTQGELPNGWGGGRIRVDDMEIFKGALGSS